MRTGIGTEAVKQTGWNIAICDLDSQIEELKERIAVLAGRIEPLFSPEQSTSGADKAGQPNPPKAKAIQEIDAATYRIQEIKAIINEMIQRIEI